MWLPVVITSMPIAISFEYVRGDAESGGGIFAVSNDKIDLLFFYKGRNCSTASLPGLPLMSPINRTFTI